ncbi:FeoA family protein [Clostridium sp. Marseille-P299]|uniref:FeoA family protein n=1 Tax=Clostridium sp. Marseille-P299 TaxID=1805477 RepID=UPI00082D76BE|nr:FeoA family protein [Clostridium sp. Marseille-P299]
MTLRECKVDRDYIVEDMDLEQATMVRLKALGLTDGTRIHILNNKRGGSVIFHVRGTRLAVGKDIAEAINVKEDERKVSR